jgi:site-specific DNA recombinase
MRALIAVRLSRVTDATTSPERQLAKCREVCEQRGWEVAGVAEDLDISAGKTTPFDRPQLGDWLKNRVGEFDAIVFFRADRIVRRLFDLADLMRWADEHRVTLVSATEAHFDLSSDFGDVIALLVAKVAELELSAISARNASAAQHNIKAGKYRGGVPPWGYLPSESTGEWRFVQDADQVSVIREVVARVLEGEPLRAVAHDLTARRVPTPRDAFATAQGRETKGYEWHSAGLKRALTSPALLGQVVSGGAVVRSQDGSPVVRSEPILTREVFDRLGVELAERENRKEPTKRTTALLLRVIYCGVCGKPGYRLKGGKGRAPRYRCASAQYKTHCGNTSIPLADAEKIVDAFILRMLGDSERMDRVWDTGSDHSAELADVTAELVDAAGQIGSPAFKAGTPQRDALDARIAALAERQEKLAAESVKPAQWAWVPTGEQFSDWWSAQDVVAKNVWLRSHNIRVEFSHGRMHFDFGDLETLTKQVNAGPTAKVAKEMFVAIRESGARGTVVGVDGSVTLVP